MRANAFTSHCIDLEPVARPNITMSTPTPPENAASIPRAVWIALMTIGALIVVLLAAVLYKISVPGSPQAPASSTASASAPASGTAPQASQAPASAQPAQQPRSAVAVTGTSPSRAAPSNFPAMRQGSTEASRTTTAPSARDTGAQSFQPQTFTQQAAPAAPAVCADCGTVEAVTPVQRPGSSNGLGAVVGGVLGGVLGNQVGGGNGRTAATVIGAVGGGLAGNEVQKRMDATTVYQVRIRMDDGATHVLTLSSAPPVGQRVRVGANGSISPM
jgi:outer membrane lipoprotein SlyB